MKVSVTLFALIAIAVTGFSATIYVPDNYPGIQDAINASAGGDTIIVRPGNYVENIDFVGKAITVRSEQGAAFTTIDGNQAGSVVTFRNQEIASSVIEGFTITNGSGNPLYSNYYGGGIICDHSSPTITRNIIRKNFADMGGGIWCWYTSPPITNNIITENTADRGGGFASTGSKSAMVSNTILGNSAGKLGGGIYCLVSAPTAVNTILWDNAAPVGPEIWIGDSRDPSTFTISYSDVDGGQSSVYVDTNCTLNWGAGMFDLDPLFAGSATEDYHLTWRSPCRNTGTNTPVFHHSDLEGDPRIALGTVDIGADEFYPHLYYVGQASPASYISIRTIGPPGAWVWLASGSGVLDPPIQTKYGTVFMQQPFKNDWVLGNIPADGVLRIPAMIPSTWLPGERYPYQAMIGPAVPYPALLTNHLEVTVE